MMSEREFNELINDEILIRHKDLLKKLSMYSRVICICKDNEANEFYLEECCDNYFRHTLTKDECMELYELFKEIAETII